ncbi:GNAT family N-acetyltransferase [Chitinophaga caeni]|uniref:GNAT family N-acetyltransferase n=1 Tax=Chitinophaga caeni TaxID=2029983 RepID=A0A291QY17_9BACT|nr:GNAT family N-acetyltransferase [Chitinophaga caeni]ATL48838.1 GNAT family N-acetyltransferase [Chitinophaga caeni]
MNLPDISIRTNLLPGDAGLILYQHGLLYSREFKYDFKFESYVAGGLQDLLMHFNPGKDAVWLAFRGQDLTGFISSIHRSDDTAQLRFFFVNEKSRGSGLGKYLMELWVSNFRSRPYKEAYLWTTREQLAAIALYKKFGFQLVEEAPSEHLGKALVEQKYVLTK